MDDLIAVRIKDGIFAGNAGAAADKTLLIMNKITHIINCAGAEVPDFFLGEPGFSYLSFPWKDVAGSVCTTILFDAADDNIHRAVQFIDEALAAGECVLVHSVYGNSRSPALIAAYMIMKYGWKLESALLYLKMAHPDSDIKPHFQRQLRQFAKRHDVDHDIFAQDVDDSQFGLDNDQWMLRNTLLNGLLYKDQMTSELYQQCAAKVDVGNPVNGRLTKARITFVDTQKGTDVDSLTTCPVVDRAAPFPANPASTEPGTFLGLRGHSCLRTSRRLPSILSRSTSPCSHRLESDPRTCPKGRQSLPIVHSGATEASTGVLAKAVDQTPALRAWTPTSSTHSSLSIDRPAKARDRDGRPAPAQVQRSSGEPARSIDYARLAPPTQLRSPFATLGSSHKYRNGSPLPTPKDKKGTTKEGHTRIQSSPVSRPGGTTSVSSASMPTSAWVGSSFGLNNPTSIRGAPRTGSPLASNRLTRDVVGRPSAASYRGIAPYRSTAASRTATEPTNRAQRSSNPSPSRRGVDQATSSRSGSRRRTMSPVYVTTKRSASGGRTPSGTEDKPHSRARSPKAQRHQDPNLGSLNNSFASNDSNYTSGGANGAGSKQAATVRRQPPPVISSRRPT